MEVPDYMHGQVIDLLGLLTEAALRRDHWAVILRLAPELKDNKWTLTWGDLTAEGDSPEAAVYAFNVAMGAVTAAPGGEGERKVVR